MELFLRILNPASSSQICPPQIVVLAWGESSYDLSQLIRVLGQICHAQRGREGSVAVVLSQASPSVACIPVRSAGVCCGLLLASIHGLWVVFPQGQALS